VREREEGADRDAEELLKLLAMSMERLVRQW